MADANTLALLHFDNSVIEDEIGNITWQNIDGLALSDDAKFGPHSAYSAKATPRIRSTSNCASRYSYTFECWLKVPQNFSSAHYVFFVGKDRNTDNNYVCVNGNRAISFEWYTNGSTGGLSTPSNSFPKGEWFHLAISRASGSSSLLFFVNGLLVYEAKVTYSSDLNLPNQPYNIGGHYWESNSSPIYIDEFRISNIARYTKNFTPPTRPFGDIKGLCSSLAPINLLDKTSITGITPAGIEPTGTSRRLVFGVDGTWNKLTTDGAGAATLTAVTTQALTADSVLSEGNTIAELQAVTSVPGFVGKLVYPAAALFAPDGATVMPTLGLTIDGEIDTTVNVYEYTDYSQEYVLGDTDVAIVSVVAEITKTGSGAVDITARLYQNGAWGEYMALNAVQMQQASKIQLKAVYTVQTTDGSDSVHIDAVTITYNTAGAVVSDATTDIVTVTERFENDLAYVHAYAKHERLIDAEIEAYCSLRKQPHQRAMYQVGNGTGALATYQLPDTGVNQDTLQVFIDGNQIYSGFGYNTETSQITVTADLGAVISASYEYGWEPSTWVQMTKGSTQVNDSGLCTTEYTYVIPTHNETFTVTAVKYSLVRPEGTVTNATIGVGTGKRQIIQLPHYAKTETIVCNGSWSYNYDSKRLTIIAPEGEDIVISYDWIAETPHVYGIAAGWAETIE